MISTRTSRDVRDEGHLARPFDGGSELDLMTTAGACDAAGTDLALLGDEALERLHVLVVDVVDLVLAEVAVPPLGLA
jgi:hypothetical protein